MQEHLNVPVKLRLLLILDDLFDFSLFHNVLLLFFKNGFRLFANFHFYLRFQFSEFLGLFANMFMHSEFHLMEVLFVDFPSFPQGKTLLSLPRTSSLDIHSWCKLDLFSIHESLFNIISNRHVDKSIIKKHGLIPLMVSHLSLIPVSAKESIVLLSILDCNLSL